MVKRYTELGYQRVRGEFVKYPDYAKLEKRIAELEKLNHEFKCEMRAKENVLLEDRASLQSALDNACALIAAMKRRRKGKYMKIISWHRSDGRFWIRIFGVGFAVIDRKKQPPPFSVRNGYSKELRIGKYAIKSV